jgi:twitching motility protein PilT
MPSIDIFVKKARELGASDLHLVSGDPPLFRVMGELRAARARELTLDELRALSFEIITPRQREVFERDGQLDFAYASPDAGRARGNLARHQNGMSICLRIVAARPPALDTLGLPEVVKRFCELHQGLVLVTGPAGSGKTTTLAAMVDHINAHWDKHVLTIEDPIEYVHVPVKAIVNQREVGTHTRSGLAALRGALRENPDVILVGELRDRESIELALGLAETGHLVMGTLMTGTAHKTIDRLVDAFPAGSQNQARTALAETVKGVLSQRLLRRADGPGLVLAAEVLVITSAVANMIRDGKTFQLPSIMQTGRNVGMCRMDDALQDLFAKKTIALETAVKNAVDPKRFRGGAATPRADL